MSWLALRFPAWDSIWHTLFIDFFSHSFHQFLLSAYDVPHPELGLGCSQQLSGGDRHQTNDCLMSI